MPRLSIIALAAVLAFAAPSLAVAETKTVRVMQQYGLPYVPQMVMQSRELIEKHAKAAGITDLTVTYNHVAGASQSADALLTDSADFVSVGVPTLITLWSKTHGTQHEVRGLSAEQSMPFYLITSNPAIHTVKDFSDKDRIAVQGVKISAQALVLEMAAAQAFGEENYAKLDPLTIQMSHPDALAALLSGHSEITAHLGVAPFQNYEMADKRLHLVFSSYDILGGKHTNGVLAMSKRFHDANPQVTARGLRRPAGGERLHQGPSARGGGNLPTAEQRQAQFHRRDRGDACRSGERLDRGAREDRRVCFFYEPGRPPFFRASLVEGHVLRQCPVDARQLDHIGLYEEQHHGPASDRRRLRPMHQAGVTLLQEHCDVRLHRSDEPGPLWESLADAQAVIVRAMNFDAQAIERCPSLRIIAKHGAGVDNIDILAATRRGIMVSNTGGANAIAVAELAVTLMLATLRRVPEIHRMVAEGRFTERWNLLFGDLWERTVGIVGFGKIGRLVARMCKGGFDATILAYDPALSAGEIAALGARKVDDLGELCARSDIVSVHTPFNPRTRGMIGAAELARLRKHAILVTTARGGVVDEAALIAALQRGDFYGAGVDVYEQEPPAADNPLLSLPNVVLSPHVGGATDASRRRASTESAEAVLAVLSGGKPEYLLNPQVVQAAQ